MLDGVMSNLLVSTGQRKLKLHDSAVMFYEGVWFRVLIMLPLACSTPNTEVTISFCMAAVHSSLKQQKETNMGILRHLNTTHIHWWTDTITDMHTKSVLHTHTHTLPLFSVNDLSALIWKKWFYVMKQTGKMIFLFISGQSRPWPFFHARQLV